MKNLLEYINHEFIIEDLYKIDCEIICESLKCKVLKEVAAQLLNYNKEEQETINKRKKEAEEENYRYWGPDKSKSPLFAKVFANNFYIAWDKISDSDVTIVDATSWDKSTPHNSANIRKVINGKKNSMLIIQNPKTKEYEFLIYSGGKLIVLNKILNRDYDYRKVGEEWSGLNQKQKIEMCQGKTLYYIDNIIERAKDASDLNYKRREEKKGMIYMDPESLKRIAKDNRERYNKIITKMKSMRINNDQLFDKCNDIIKRVTDKAIEIAKDPISNADLITGISYIMPYIHDEVRYQYTAGTWKGHNTGVNGLLPLIMEYAKDLKYVNSEGSGYYMKNVEATKEKIEKTLKKIDELAKKYNITF